MFKKLLVIAALLLILPFSAYCGWEESVEGLKATSYYMVPLPPATREIKQEKTQMMGGEFTITIYASELSFAEVVKFYRERLTREGWEDMSKNPKVKDLASASFFNQALIFIKENEIINIQNLPSANQQETAFSLSRGNIQVLKTGETQVSEVEFKDLPVYPNATAAPLSSMRTPVKEQAGYTTADSIEKIMQFYREELSGYGWEIKSEIPLNESGAQELKDCPGCEKLPAESLAKFQNSTMKMAAFNITKQGKSCYIGVTEMSMPSSGSSGATIISISCSK